MNPFKYLTSEDRWAILGILLYMLATVSVVSCLTN